MCGTQDTIDDVEVSSLKFADHLRDEIWPFGGKVFTPYYADCITELNTHNENEREKGLGAHNRKKDMKNRS